MTISFPEPRPGGVSLTQELSEFWSNGTTRKSWKYIETCRWYSDDNSWAFILLTELREDAVRFGESQAGLFDMHPEFSWEWRGACSIVRARQSSKSCFCVSMMNLNMTYSSNCLNRIYRSSPPLFLQVCDYLLRKDATLQSQRGLHSCDGVLF